MSCLRRRSALLGLSSSYWTWEPYLSPTCSAIWGALQCRRLACGIGCMHRCEPGGCARPRERGKRKPLWGDLIGTAVERRLCRARSVL